MVKSPPKNWFVVEKAEITHYLFVASPIYSISCKMEDLGFPSLKYSGTEFIKDGGNYVFVEKIWRECAKKYLKIIIKNPKTLFKLHREIIKFADALFKFGKNLLKKDFTEYSNRRLAECYEKFEYLHNEAHIRRAPMWVMETSGEVFSKYVINYLSKEIKKQNLNLIPEVVFANLSAPLAKNFTTKEKEEFLRIALELKSIKNLTDKIIKEKLKKHVKTYCWLPYGISGPAWNTEYFVIAMKDILKKKSDEISKEIKEIKDQPLKIRQVKKDIYNKLKIDKLHKDLIKLAEESIQVKAYSKEALFFGYYAAEELFKEIAKRLGIDLRLLRHMLPWEIKPALLGKKVDRKELEKRWEYSFYYVDHCRPYLFIGDEAKNFVGRLNLKRGEAVQIDLKEIKGSCAQPGKVQGKVKIINNPSEMGKMEEGDILVSHMTDPEIVPAMKKATAIVTDMGGITCHAAIVSRELGIPCVIGTKIATKVLKDGDLVEVDAEKGIIKKIK